MSDCRWEPGQKKRTQRQRGEHQSASPFRFSLFASAASEDESRSRQQQVERQSQVRLDGVDISSSRQQGGALGRDTYRVGGSILGLVSVDGLEVTRVRDDGGVLLERVEGRHFADR